MLEASIQLNSTSRTLMARQKGRCLPSVEQVSKYQLISPTDFNFFQAEEGDSPKCKSLKRWVEPTSIKQTMPSAPSFVVNSDPIHKFHLKRTWYPLPKQGSHSPPGVFLYSQKTSLVMLDLEMKFICREINPHEGNFQTHLPPLVRPLNNPPL